MAKKKKSKVDKSAATTPATPGAETIEGVTPPSFPIQINIVNQRDDGQVELEVSYSNEFREWFMQDQGLKRWSEKRFQQIVGPLLQEYYDNLAAQQAAEHQGGVPVNPEP
tara:strand:+ start:197 stop:526 length:330 start_codon:yes stop_codon:yes gene_type:complete